MPDDVVYKGRFIWNWHKNELNKRKHHISFEKASQVFDDPFLYEEFDVENSIGEERYTVTGSMTGLINDVLVTVSVVYRGDLIRIFSARDADPVEEDDYYEQFAAFHAWTASDFGGINGN
jgi:uncharacterized DUF497 family protein